ncbi:hypothetical protein [Flavobacterium sp. J27]|uniref:hypothetical protein n=1 Tax=Flavobacterium sp. J27 TaxID=2060419 RepID=UPI00102F3524|nr:hypothetical protein [Flavobacterium sp. J27]
MKENKRRIVHWDFVTKIILVISFLTIIFSFISPLILTLPAHSEKFNFTNTGPIGDTIGGIMNPFIALAGVFLTFLAFYMQIKANEIQIDQFQKGIKRERNLRILNEKKDLYNRLSLLKIDLKEIQSDIKFKAERLKNYFEKEKEFPFQTNILKRTSTKNYTRILEFDRLGIYNGFGFFLSHKKNWIENFSRLYDVLDFLTEYFHELYNTYNYHSEDIFKKKKSVIENLTTLMDNLTEFMTAFHMERFGGFSDSDFNEADLAKNTIEKYHEIINENYDENNNLIKETDLEKINTEVLKKFITEANMLRNKKMIFDPRLDPILRLAMSITNEMNLIRQNALNFAASIENEYNNLVIDEKDNKSYLTIINEIQSILEEELSKINLEEEEIDN